MLNFCGSGGIQEQLRVSHEVSLEMSVVAAVMSRVDRAEDVLHSGSLMLGESALVGGEKSQFLLMCTSTRRLLEFLE